MDLVEEVYNVTKGFPADEKFGLVSQIRRAGVSVPVNISEGSARNSPRDYIRFVRISFGSLSELETLLLIGARLGMVEKTRLVPVLENIKIISVQLSGLIRSLEKYI